MSEGTPAPVAMQTLTLADSSVETLATVLGKTLSGEQCVSCSC